jgi:hypothetical protein
MFFSALVVSTTFLSCSAEQVGIHYGEVAPPGAYPWFVWIGNCGGALIDPYYIITAAHCVSNTNTGETTAPHSLRVYIGAYKHPRFIPGSSSNFTRVSKVISHPLFFQDIAGYDIALLRLETAALVKPLAWKQIHMGWPQQQLSQRRVTLIGMGRTETENVSEVLLQLHTKIASVDAKHPQLLLEAVRMPDGKIGHSGGGDSGSPVIYSVPPGGAQQLVAVHNGRTGEHKQMYESLVLDERIQRWIQTTMDAHIS